MYLVELSHYTITQSKFKQLPFSAHRPEALKFLRRAFGRTAIILGVFQVVSG